MSKIIQIEELVYGRLPNVSKAEWIDMLTTQGAHPDYTTFKNDYLLLEYTDYRFDNGKMISSERFVYNIDYSTYDQKQNVDDDEDTIEVPVVIYNRVTDHYTVLYVHYPISEEYVSPDLSHILSEADMPITGVAHQAPAEKRTEVQQTKPIPSTPKPVSVPTPTPPTRDTLPTYIPKAWRYANLMRLKELYEKGYTMSQLLEEFKGRTEQGVLNQLKYHLDIKHPFMTVSEEELYKKRWTKEEDRKLLEMYQIKRDFQEVASIINHSIPEIRARLYWLVGLHNPFDASMNKRTRAEVKAATERYEIWKAMGLNILSTGDYRIAFEEEDKQHAAIRRKVEDEMKKVNGFYVADAHIFHPQYGEVTIIKDNANMTKYLLADGTKRTVLKK